MPEKKRCKATIKFGDDFGDNSCTFHCQLEAGHEGSHKEAGDMGYGVLPMPYTLTWEKSAKELDKAMKAKHSSEKTRSNK